MLIIYVACVLHMLTAVLSTPYRHKSIELIEDELEQLENVHYRQIGTNEENDDIRLNNALERLSSYDVRRTLNRHGLNGRNYLQRNLHEGTQTKSKRQEIFERHRKGKGWGHGHGKGKGKGKGHGKGKGKKLKGLRKGHFFDNQKDIPVDLKVVLEAMFIEKEGKTHEAAGKSLGKKKAKIERYDEHLFEDSRKRNFYTKTNLLWPNGIVPYVIDSVFNATHTGKILNAIEEFHSLTCIQWIPFEDTKTMNLGHEHYISFVNGTGCTSYIGRVGRSPQTIVLSIPQNCVNHGTIIHEMMHALGALHEMSRPDRDNYVQIMWDRISSGKRNFEMTNSVSTIYPYDMSSVLQYGTRSFSRNGMETILVKDWRLKFLANVGNDLMFYDVAEVTSAYECSANCPSLACKNGGFTIMNCTCYCPDVLTGDLCEQPISNTDTCGGTINVEMGTEVTLTSPNYPSPYSTGMICTWIIKGVENNILRGTIVDMDISNNDYACYHWMEIRYNLMGQKGPERCGSTKHEVWDATVDEEMNTMIIILNSYIGSDKPAGTGFKMNFVSIGKGCLGNPCKFGSCDSPINTDSYVCTCDYGFTGKNCSELSVFAPIGCTAEVGEYCMFMQEPEPTTDQMNWDTGSKAPYIYSGPRMAKEGFVYLYLHSSGKTKSGDKAVMSTQMEFPKVERCLSFWYHMYSYTSSSMGSLNVFVSDSTGKNISEFSKTANQGKTWLYEEIDIPAVENLKVSFVGIRNGWMSYMAVDDIWLIPGTCGSPLTSTTSSVTTTQKTTPSVATTQKTTPSVTTTQKTTPGTTTTQKTTPIVATTQKTTPSVATTQKTTPSTTTTQKTTPSVATTQKSTPSVATTQKTTPSTTTTQKTTPSVATTQKTTPSVTTQKTTPSVTTALKTTPTIKTTLKTTTSVTTAQKTTPTVKITSSVTTTTPKTTTMETTTTTPDGTSPSVSYSCGFESSDGKCIFENSFMDDFDWTLGHSGGTPTSGTGPANAYSGDQYAYIEVTKKKKKKVAILSTFNTVLEASKYCLQFHYHMRGAGSGSLKVWVQEYKSGWDEVFKADGNQGDRWLYASIDIPYHNDLVIDIEADKKGNKGDIAIDAILLSTGACTCDRFVCGFESSDETCIFRNKGNDDFDWKLGQSQTPTRKTGPSSAYSGNQYAYIEVNGKKSGEAAILSTDGTVLAASEYCLQFHYHMYGAHIGNLVVYIEENGSESSEIVFTKDGDQGNHWNHACLNLSYPNDITIEIEANKGGQTKTKNKGDIALDDIQLSTGACTCPYTDSDLK